jgi:restriction endonuclease S subunit
VGAILSDKVQYKDGFKLEPIRNLIIRNREKEILEGDEAYKQVTIKLYGKGVVQRGDELIFGKDIGTKNQFRISEGQFIMSKIDARNGAFGIVPAELEGAITTQDFLSYNINAKKILPEFFNLTTGTKHFAELCQKASSGTTGRQRVDEKAFLGFRIPVPNIEIQKFLISDYQKLINEANTFEERAKQLDELKDIYLINELGLKQIEANKSKERFKIVNFENLGRWDVWNSSVSFQATKYKFQEFGSVILGKPKYGANTKSVLRKSDVRYIRITDINEEGYLNEEFASAHKVEEQYILDDFDFLIARSGNTVGKTFLYRIEIGKAIYAGYLVKYVLNQEIVDPYYILFYTKSAPFKEWIASNQRISAQPNINGQEYLSAPIIIPKLEVQKRIAFKLSRIYEQSRQLKVEAHNRRKRAQDVFESAIFKIDKNEKISHNHIWAIKSGEIGNGS